jgi:voltage-gated potassium channel
MKNTKNILIFGYGSFGKQLYKNLSPLGHNIRVVSGDEDSSKEARDENIDVITINIKKNDDILSLNIDAQKDMLYCAMSKTANNLFLVLTLRTLYPKANIIAISNSFENTRKLNYAGANSVIDLYEATSRRVVNILTKPAVTRALDEIIYHQNDLKMAEIALPKNSPLDEKFVQDIEFKKMGVILIAIIDKELGQELVFTDHRINHKLDAGDTLVVVAKNDDLKKFNDLVFNKR